MAFRVLEVQQTPNPNAAKYVLDRPIVDQPMSFFEAAAAKGNATAESLFGIPGVASLLLLGDFVTVNKTPDAKWADISPKVKSVLAKL